MTDKHLISKQKKKWKTTNKDPLLKPKKIAHIGLAVKKIKQALPFYTDSLGLELEKVEKLKSEGVKIAFLKVGESRLELLEPIDQSSPIQQFIDNNGEGIHHIALEIDNIDNRLLQLKTEGIQLINDKPKSGAHQSQIAFIHPSATNGVLFELCQQIEERE